jgi:isopenicillin N synthase-like dioxygenase
MPIAPTMLTDFDKVPLIDLAAYFAGDAAARRAVGMKLARACEEIGFLYLANHGIDPDLIFRTRNVARDFFHRPIAEKRALHLNVTANHRGYIGPLEITPDTGKPADVREAFKVGPETGEDDPDYRAGNIVFGPNVWPAHPAAFGPTVGAYYEAMTSLSRDIFRLFALGLGLGEDHFMKLVAKPASIMNLNYYAATAPGDAGSGIGAHSDYEAFAILWQDEVGGLEVENAAGAWIPVPPIPGSYVVNIGDLMARWTNGRFSATRHRVVNCSGRERLSIAYFGNVDYATEIRCLPVCAGPNEPARFPPTTAGRHLMEAIRRTYPDLPKYRNCPIP